VFRDDTCVFVSQSGETADTLRALEYAKVGWAEAAGRKVDPVCHLNKREVFAHPRTYRRLVPFTRGRLGESRLWGNSVQAQSTGRAQM
jgi:hypothetical protein